MQQSVLRGGSKFIVFKTFNPPISRSNWANVYVEEPRDDSYRHKSDYRSVPVEWLGQQFLDDAEHLKRQIQEPISMNTLDYLSDSVQISLSCWKSERFQTKKFRSIKASIRDKTGDGIRIPKRLFVWLMYLIRKKFFIRRAWRLQDKKQGNG